MTTGICVIHRIVIAIAIQVQTVDGFGVQVGSIIGRNESAPFGGVVPGVAVIQAGIIDRAIAREARMGTFECAISTFLFYHLLYPPSSKSLPGRNGLGGMCVMVFLGNTLFWRVLPTVLPL